MKPNGNQSTGCRWLPLVAFTMDVFLDAESIRRVRPNVGSDAGFVAKRQPITARNRDPIFFTGLARKNRIFAIFEER